MTTCALLGAVRAAPLVAREPGAAQYAVSRLNRGDPIITASMFRQAGADAREWRSINGPCVIRLPDWLPADKRVYPEARYYMYFAHHGGKYIRMAWSETPAGPWYLYRTGRNVPTGTRGVLDMGSDSRIELDNAIVIKAHIASPDVVVDHRRERFVLFFHGPSSVNGGHNQQMTFATTSPHGLNFNGRIRPVRLGNGYFRTFTVRGRGYAIANGGRIWRAPEGARPAAERAISPPADPGFHFGRQPLWEDGGRASYMGHAPEKFGLGGQHDAVIRHVGIRRVEGALHLFYTVKRGDPPERIMCAAVDVSGDDWRGWKATSVAEVLRPERAWEGADRPLERSRKGGARDVRQLRDPYVLEDGGRIYLYYCGAGEGAIGVAEIRPAGQTP